MHTRYLRLTLLLTLILALGAFGNMALAQEGEGESEEVEIEVMADDDMAMLSGRIVISFQQRDTQTWQALCDAYTAMHPDVECIVELKPQEGYQEWIRTQFAAGTPDASYVNANVVADLVNDKAFLDLSAYLDAENPYSMRPWREDFDQGSLLNMTDPLTGEMYMLNLETVQTLWYYNRSLFEQAGILDEAMEVAAGPLNQPTWDQFLGWCDQLSEAGIIPLGVEGDYRSLWQIWMGWLFRMYADQYTRDEAEIVRCQPGDYCFREGVDDVWVYDPTDPYNDDRSEITFNPVRKMIALRDGVQRVDGPAWRDMYSNFKAMGDRCAQDGWVGTYDAYPLFLTGQAAMRLDGAWLLASFEKDIRSLAEGTYNYGGVEEGQPTPTPSAEDLAAAVFELGTFNNPTMEGPEVDAPARTISVNIGFWGVPRKDQAQNDLEVDFLMFVTSPEGAGLYLDNRLDPNNANGGIAGPMALNDVALPDPVLEQRFEGLRLIGNTEKDNAGSFRSRGVNDYQPTVREWVDLAQQYFTGEITLDEFLESYQASLMNHFDGILDHINLTAEDLEDPSKKPANY